MKKGLIFTVMLISMLALGYSQTTLSGTYRYSTNAYVTFTGNAFKGLWNATTPMSGTYSVSGARLTLNITDGPKARNTWVWTITDANTLKDQDGDTWKKEGAGGTAQARTSPPVEWNVNNMATWIEAVGGVRSGGNNKEHKITVTGEIAIPVSNENTFGSVNNVTVTIQGDGTLSPSGNGSVFIIGADQTVVLNGDIILRGRDNNNASVVRINEKGTFRMEDNSKVTGNTSSSYNSGDGGVYVKSGTFTMNSGAISENTGGIGVRVSDRGTFTMNGGTISGSGNESHGGAYGVRVGDRGTFTMNNGVISDNTGGGVFVDGGNTFTMKDGVISGNTNSGSGGGVYVGGTFTMSGGAITGNKAYTGGGVYVNNWGTFTMNGGVITDNTAGENGGGVLNNRTFTMNGGDISGNTASEAGGGVYVGIRDSSFTIKGGTISGNSANGEYSGGGGVHVLWGSFTMQGGTISGNATRGAGGGICVSRGTFTKTGGTISGNDAVEADKNKAEGKGHVVYNDMNDNWRNATAGPRMNTDTYGFWLND